MRRNFRELEAKMSPERRAAVKQRVEQAIAEIESARSRKVAEITREELPDKKAGTGR